MSIALPFGLTFVLSSAGAAALAATAPGQLDPLFEVAYLKAAAVDWNDNFGWASATDGDRVVIGVPREDSASRGVDGDPADDGALDSGAAYVFVREGNVWRQEAYLKASNADIGDQFGYSVAVSGDTVAVGAVLEASAARTVDGDEADNSAPNAGAVYVFRRSASGWQQEAYIKPSNADPGDFFGWSVSLTEGMLVVGAPGESGGSAGVGGDPHDNSRSQAGAAYVFRRSGTSWSQSEYLKASNPDAGDYFGHGVACSPGRIVVGAPHEASKARGIDGDQSNNGAWGSGAVYVFDRVGATWTQSAYVKGSRSESANLFGEQVALDSQRFVVGIRGDDDASHGVNGTPPSSPPDLDNSGAACVFFESPTGWIEEAFVKASNPDSGDVFGTSVAIAGDVLLIGAPDETSNAQGLNGDQQNNDALFAGAGYLFRRTGNRWAQTAYIKASNNQFGWGFGQSLAVAEDTFAIGAYTEFGSSTGVNGDPSTLGAPGSGAAFVFDLGTLGSLGVRTCAPSAANSTGASATLSAAGSTVVAEGTLVLRAEGLPLRQPGYFLASQFHGAPVTPPGSQGTLCLGKPIGRHVGAFEVQDSGPAGTFRLEVDFLRVPQPSGFVSILPGATWSFQAWYRDTVGGLATSNFSDALTLTFS